MPTAEIVAPDFGNCRPLSFRHPSERVATFGCRATEIGLSGIASRLKMSGRPMRAVIAAIRILVKDCGFPPPRSPRFVNRKRMTGADAVWARSIWDRDEVDQWFESDTPPSLAAAAAEDDRQAVRAGLRARAEALVA